MTNRIKAILTALLTLMMMSSMCATAAAEYDPITDNGMKAYVWNSDEEGNWNYAANRVANTLTASGFDVIRHNNPSPSLIYQTIEDNDVKVYWGLGHGADHKAATGTGSYYYATDFGDSIEERDYPLTIGIFQHCGEYLCYTEGRWLQESTQGNNDVVAQRFFGSGWCEEASEPYEGCEDCLSALGTELVIMGYGAVGLFARLDLGYTYSDASNLTSWTFATGRKQGNRDLRYPQFCGDVNYDMVVDLDDVTLLQNHLNDPVTYPIHSDWDADVNGYGGIDINDVNLLSDHVNNPQAHPLNPRGWFVVYDWNEWDDDCVITNAEISLAQYYWTTTTPINGHIITNAEISLLNYQWATGDVC